METCCGSVLLSAFMGFHIKQLTFFSTYDVESPWTDLKLPEHVKQEATCVTLFVLGDHSIIYFKKWRDNNVFSWNDSPKVSKPLCQDLLPLSQKQSLRADHKNWPVA